VRAVECDYYTDAITYTKVTILDTLETGLGAGSPGLGQAGSHSEAQAADGGSAAPGSHGEVHVVSRVVGFKKIKFYTNENVGSGELDLPEQQMHTSSYWLTIPAAVMRALPFGADDKRDGIVGLAFAMKNIAQLLLMCDAHDIGISVDGGSVERQVRAGAGRTAGVSAEPRIFIYDNYPGGIGFSRPLFDMHLSLLARTRELIDACPCASGCPSCVGPEGITGPHARQVASQLLQCVLQAAV
jgi:DEAD/DEAH box helicase domain-containing protein